MNALKLGMCLKINACYIFAFNIFIAFSSKFAKSWTSKFRKVVSQNDDGIM